MTKPDRRVQRTRDLLQKALIDLINEIGYDAITIQDIVDRANLGRTTFYVHYNSKDELFMTCHKAIMNDFHLGARHLLSREELLSPQASPEMITALRNLEKFRALLYPIFQGEDSGLILRRIREGSAQQIEASLCAAFTEAESAIPFTILANYIAGARMALVQWWLEKRQPYTLENLAQTFQRLQCAAIRDAFGIMDCE
jgi:AcrR family transcriptional regulator